MRRPAASLLLLVLIGGCVRGDLVLDENLHRLTSSQPVGALAAFPRVRPHPDAGVPQALARGRLALENGCLRLVTADGSRLIIWPASAIPAPDGSGVMDGGTGNRVRVGDEMVTGGGEVDRVNIQGLDATVPPQCGGPYWLAGGGFFKAPEPEWRTEQMGNYYSVRLPADLRAMSAQGIDSMVHRFEGPALRLNFDYGAMACGVRGGAEAGHAVSRAYIDQRPVEIDRYVSIEDGVRVYRLDAMMPVGPANSGGRRASSCLSVAAQCVNASDCDVARGIVSTVRFGRAGR